MSVPWRHTEDNFFVSREPNQNVLSVLRFDVTFWFVCVKKMDLCVSVWVSFSIHNNNQPWKPAVKTVWHLIYGRCLELYGWFKWKYKRSDKKKVIWNLMQERFVRRKHWRATINLISPGNQRYLIVSRTKLISFPTFFMRQI